jgi:hypothetical protein
LSTQAFKEFQDFNLLLSQYQCQREGHMVLQLGRPFLCQQNLQVEFWTYSDPHFSPWIWESKCTYKI